MGLYIPIKNTPPPPGNIGISTSSPGPSWYIRPVYLPESILEQIHYGANLEMRRINANTVVAAVNNWWSKMTGPNHNIISFAPQYISIKDLKAVLQYVPSYVCCYEYVVAITADVCYMTASVEDNVVILQGTMKLQSHKDKDPNVLPKRISSMEITGIRMATQIGNPYPPQS
jgi:hypothetical protein